MKPLFTLLLAFGTAATTTSYLSRMADTWLTRGIAPSYDYATAVLLSGLELAATTNATIRTLYESRVIEPLLFNTSSSSSSDGSIADYNYTFYSLDNYRIGTTLLTLYNHNHNNKRKQTYRHAAAKIRTMLNTHPRTAHGGGFWHRAPVYPEQMWLDGIFMADVFYAQYTALFHRANMTAWDDILLQFSLIEAHCSNSSGGLLKHGFDESKRAVWADPVTGASPLVWSRAVGWFFVALTEVLEVWPVQHGGYGTLVGWFRELAEAVRLAQDKSGGGGWWLIMDDEYVGVEGNYIESSASAMFTYGMLKGVDMGLLDAQTYLAPAKKAYENLVERFVVEAEDGLLDWEGTVLVGSLSGNATFEYYTSVALSPNDFKGIGPFMWASYQYEKLK